MATLHIVSRGPSDNVALTRCLKSTNPGDALLLMDEAVCVAVRGSESEALLVAAGATVAVHVLTPSLIERGLQERPLVAGVVAIGFEGFVDLTVAFDTSVAWS